MAFVLDAMSHVAAGHELFVFGTDGAFHSPERARAHPLLVSAANWMATAALAAQRVPDAILIDIGSTTTDIIPIVAGAVAAHGRTDPDRLASGELLYAGALRTPVEALVHRVPLRQGSAGVSAEGFALTGDVYLWLGRLRAEDYTVNTPDGRPASPEFAGERLARVVCGDREMLSDADIGRLALAVAEAQVDGVANGIRRLLGRHSHVRVGLVTGLGDFIGAEAAQRAGLHVIRLAEELGPGAARAAPAAAVAQLLGHALAGSRR